VARDSKIAVLPVGYWDGYDRGLSSVGHVLIRGHRCKVVGRVCMNMFMVDVTDVSGVKPEDEVVLIGKQGKEEISAEEIAGQAGTIQYEFLTRINPRIARTLVT
jgi:alanine racemase